MTAAEEVAEAASGWSTLRELQDRIGVPQGHRHHKRIRAAAVKLVASGRMETRRLDGREREYRAVPREAPARPSPLDCLEDGMTAADVAVRMGVGARSAGQALARMERKGLVHAQRRGRFASSRWYTNAFENAFKEMERMDTAEVRGLLDGMWRTTEEIASAHAERHGRGGRREAAHERLVYEALDRLAQDGMAERSKARGRCVWRAVRWRRSTSGATPS